MVETYLTTDIIVIIVLVVVIVLIGVGAFFIHFYWTKIGVAEIWNTAKWSSMRSSFYRTINRFHRGNTHKSPSEQSLSRGSIYSDDIDDVSYEPTKINPKVTSYAAPPSNTKQKPVSIISYNNPVRTSYAPKLGQPIENTKIYNIHENNNLVSTIQKQRF